MKVLLIKDVYKLGHAGDVKRVADGYGRNFLIPQGLALLATAGAMKNAESIRTQANTRRAELNNEMGSVAAKLADLVLTFTSKAGETGKLYGSITTQNIAEAITKKTGVELDKRTIDAQPIRNLGEHKIHVRLTVDLIPTIKVMVYREGEAIPGAAAPQKAAVPAPAAVEPTPEVEAPVEEPALEAETPAEEPAPEAPAE